MSSRAEMAVDRTAPTVKAPVGTPRTAAAKAGITEVGSSPVAAVNNLTGADNNPTTVVSDPTEADNNSLMAAEVVSNKHAGMHGRRSKFGSFYTREQRPGPHDGAEFNLG